MQTIPFYSLESQHQQVDEELLRSFKAVLSKNWFILGNALEAFENEYSAFHGLKYCAGVGNGYDALCLCLRASGLHDGDEVLVPANTYIATWLAVSNTGCTIVPVEPDPQTYTIDIQGIEAKITSKTKAILPVHLYGNPCDMTAIMDIARRHDLRVIEDNAQSHGARWSGKITGSFGEINATSFYPTKNLGALGDGGAITTDNEALLNRVKQLRSYGFSAKNVCDETGVNSRLDEVQAAILQIKLKHLNEWNAQRSAIASQYMRELDDVADIQLPVSDQRATHAYHLFVIQTTFRDRLRERLSAANVQTMVHYPIPPHLQRAYEFMGYEKGSFPVTESLAARVVSLPLWPGMDQDQVSYICDVIRRSYL